MNPAELLLLGLAAVGSAWALAGYLRASRARREARRREQQGARNASETCVICHLPVDPTVDFFDENARSWWHRDCWREAVR
ncbi:MAG TPA: hypothetical protein VMT03_07605 [Polyangia bacterium]|nr:hypothetical protein [Polyangia bacterium]